MQIASPFVAALLALACATTPAVAHRLSIECKVKVERLRVEAYYDDNTPAQGAKITISRANEIIAHGTTDEHGVWSCACPPSGDYLVRAESVGHAQTKSFTVLTSADESPTAIDITRSEFASRGPTSSARDEMGTPWTKVAIGFGVIGLLFLTLWYSRRQSPKN